MKSLFKVQNLLFFAFFSFLFILVAMLFKPFFSVILWASLLYIMTAPIFNKVVKGFDTKKTSGMFLKNITAGLFSILLAFFIVLPLTFLAVRIGIQLKEMLQWAITMLENEPYLFQDIRAGSLVQWVLETSGGAIDLSTIDIRSQLMALLSRSSNTLLTFSTVILKDIGRFFLELVFIIFTLYFFLVDGPHLLAVFMRAVPLKEKYMLHFVERFRITGKNLLKGYFLVALYQGIAAYILFLIFGVQGGLVLAVMVCFCSFVPMVGAATIWAPAGILKILQGDIIGGVLLLILASFFISTMDNFLRPFLIQEKINIHPLLIFFSILGGMALFGFNGLILGPLILTLFFSALDIFRELYTDDEVPECP